MMIIMQLRTVMMAMAILQNRLMTLVMKIPVKAGVHEDAHEKQRDAAVIADVETVLFLAVLCALPSHGSSQETRK